MFEETTCYGCGKVRHKVMDYPRNQHKGRDGHPQGQCANGGLRGRRGQQGGAPRHNRLYDLEGRQVVDGVPDVITSMLKVFDFHVYTLIDSSTTLSFITHFVAKKFHVEPELLCEPYEVSTPIGISIIARKVYRNYPIFILHKILPCDFVELDMVNFDIILGMD
ncbi:MAG: hypothetical protein Q8850_02605, partial [Candidatus Phytoplasma australasiaticum]|nr:hypothetical protein [Candidatus Phytoplasma australasiaticum]